MRKLFVIVFVVLLAMVLFVLYCYNRWESLWSLEKPKSIYSVTYHQDDTIRIIMIGDSWAVMRTDLLNIMFQERLSRIIERPVSLKTKGKGGEKSRGIYQLMFENGGFGTKQLLSGGADYCVIFAGINDAAANMGKKQYVYHMKLIINFMQLNNIRPVLIEIPNVNYWAVYGDKPLQDLIGDYMKSIMAGCGMYHYAEYREALWSMLNDSDLIDSVIYVSMKGWNGDSLEINKKLFFDDQKHLNYQGYVKLDSCIIDAICQDLQ